MSSPTITTLFLDIGGVLLTNGWDRIARTRAAENFSLDLAEMDERHHLTFDIYESGKLSLDEYLDRVVFHQDRPFTKDEFRKFMEDQSRPYPDMIGLVRALKTRHGLRVAAVNNEGRELSIHRIKAFDLGSLFDCFVSSAFVHIRKPDTDIYRTALDIVQVLPSSVLYIDDREMFVDVARGLGINGIHHRSFPSTKAQMEAFGLSDAA
jgi:putative hydrolase of the HAD superfamily